MVQINGGGQTDSIFTTNELRAQLNIADSTDDDLLTQKLSAAANHVESLCGGTIHTPIPAPVREAVLMLAAWLYEQREAALPGSTGVGVVTVPFGFAELIAPYRAWEF